MKVTAREIIDKVNYLIGSSKLVFTLPRIYKNDYGIEIIHIDKFVMFKHCKFLFLERKFEIQVCGVKIELSNSEAEKIFNHTKKVLSKWINERKVNEVDKYLNNDH